MIDNRTAPYAIFILRLALGILFLAHAGENFRLHTCRNRSIFRIAWSAGWFAYVTILWEVVGAIALIIGIFPRIAAVALIPILLGAIFTVHGAAGFFSPTPMVVGSFQHSGS
ncbi:DoxX family protein [Ochrobactrum pseudogrignonense]|nr:DoxX family protein [Brucella pseudogrignonensis]